MILLNYFTNFLLILVTVTSFGDVASQNWQEALENFTWNKLENYTTWLSNNNLDPSSTISGPTIITRDISIATISYYLSNHGVRGHSANGLEIHYVIADFSNATLNIGFTYAQGLEFFGDFTANGTLSNGQRVDGEGKWFIKIEPFTVENWEITYTINPNGFLNPIEFHTGKRLMGTITEVDFGSFFEVGMPIEIGNRLKWDIGLTFADYLANTDDHPIKNLFYEYLVQVFKSTPFPVIIIGTPSRPPPTSTASTKN